jgi:hypothetical protein
MPLWRSTVLVFFFRFAIYEQSVQVPNTLEHLRSEISLERDNSEIRDVLQVSINGENFLLTYPSRLLFLILLKCTHF